MKFFVTVTVVVLILQYVESFTREGPVVETNVGRIQGLYATDGNYTMFLGIPYAKVDPENPFGKSLPQPTFDDVFEAFDDSAQCPQQNLGIRATLGIRDCLVLHVYTPHSASFENKLPVMVWIHGGSFTTGFAGRQVYGPKYIVQHDVIMVSINYRLGPFGFMCLNIPEIPGNQGLKDQIAALRWVKENIEYFGGDLNKITVFGGSAGSISIDLLLRYPEKLFNNAILMSGSALMGMYVLTPPNPTAPIVLAQRLGYITNDVRDALSFLATIDPQLVVSETLQAGIVFGPCVEQNFEEADNFLIDYPINIPPHVKDMPIMTGHTDNEMLYEYARLPPDYYETANVFNDLLHRIFDFDQDKMTELEDIVRRFYLADDNISYLQRKGVIDFSSDIVFNYPAERSIKRFLEAESDNIFLYVFSYNGNRNYIKVFLNINFGGASHADELGYLFDIQGLPGPTVEDQLVLDRMTTMWTNFAKYGLVVSQNQRALHIVFPHHFLDSPEWFGVSTDEYFQVSIMAMEESRVLVWHRDKLKLSIMSDAFLQAVFDHILGRDVVHKLMQVSETMAVSNGHLPNSYEEGEDKPMLVVKKAGDGPGITALLNRQLQATDPNAWRLGRIEEADHETPV